MRMDAEQAKNIASQESPGREDITSAPLYLELQVALAGKPGSQMGDAVIDAIPPDYKTSLKICTELLDQSRHFQLLIDLVKAASGEHGINGLAHSLTVLDSVIENCWGNSFPEADAEDEEDPWWERLNVLRELTEGTAIRDSLYRCELVAVKHLGSFSKRDIDIAEGRLEVSAEEKERCHANLIRGAFTECDSDTLAAIDEAMTRVIALCDSIDTSLAGHLGPAVISCKEIKDLTAECQADFREYAGIRLETISEEVEGTPDSADTEKGTSANDTPESATVITVDSVKSTALADRKTVDIAFTRLICFYQKFEPSSPVPFLLYRAQQMVQKNFFDILRELAPQHKDDFRQLVSILKDDPLTFLLEHSFNAFVNGESFLTGDSAEVANNENEEEIAHAVNATVADNDTIGEITSREQVLQTLLDLQRFFEQQEPSSPIPLIIQKVRNLVPKSFIDLLDEFETVTSTDSSVESE